MELTLTEFVLLAMFATFVAVPCFAVISRTLHARTEARSLKRRFICRLCLHAYEDSGREKYMPCPRCGAANERGRDPRGC
jgi:Zn finger protein HypA/HybF involved in hydrogenase expression